MNIETELDWRWTQVRRALKAIENIAESVGLPYDDRADVDGSLANDLSLSFLLRSEIIEDSAMMALLMKKGYIKFGAE